MKQCAKCLMDQTVEAIYFDKNGLCKFCLMYDEIKDISQKKLSLDNILKKIEKNKNKYDCIAGVSGGRDSTYLLYILKKKLNLNPLAVHYDNGWNTEISNKNIKNSCKKLNIDLHTEVANWNSFRNVQRSLFNASIPDVETITELGIYKVLFEAAKKNKCKYIMSGHNIDNEFLDPLTWTYFDAKYITAVTKEQKTLNYLKNIKIFNLKDLIFYQILSKIEIINITNYFEYDHEKVTKTLINECDWTPYEGHHQESVITKFVNDYYLPKKFNIDKRKTNLSARIRSNLIDKEYAKKKLNEKNFLDFDAEIIDFVLKKLKFSNQEFDEIISKKNKNFRSYPNYYNYFNLFSPLIKLMSKHNIINPYLYYKYKM